MKAFFEAIGSLFTDFLFIPLDFFRKLELENWWTANILTWIFIIICCVAFVYWMKQLQIFKANHEDDQDTTAHSFLS
ncbi:uracil phosphoribosyltransferase [Flavobacterium zepuense]|uniref:Uracil phosphoribosyltransferase n=1 Tax=Flavobacterium zepuense TaxID=2593302 RepID=A0A552UV97_9FLAO|nr:uracil phosphoribosyltransferase [Flavobacterium zepuense]TRW22142.1 uracil phosphoribosyltransferase [Flavobacterium zepuense]